MTSARPAPPRTETEVIRLLGHCGTVLLGVLLLITAALNFASNLPTVLAIGQTVFGSSAIVLAYVSWRGSRIGWSFALALDGFFAVGYLFGAPKLAHTMNIPLYVAILPCIEAAVSCWALAVLYPEYDK
jgi:hypothetical protein